MPTYTKTEEDSKITVGFRYVDQFHNVFSAETTVEVFDSLDESELDVIGRQLNGFLGQCGFYRGGDYVLMESLTEEEYDAVVDFLYDYRNNGGTE